MVGEHLPRQDLRHPPADGSLVLEWLRPRDTGEGKMEITRITPAPSSRGGYYFAGEFDAGDTVVVDAATLYSYSKFQVKVLTVAGRLFQDSAVECEKPSRRPEWWRRLLARLLERHSGEPARVPVTVQ